MKDSERKKTKNFFKGSNVLSLRVLGYQEDDGDWAAHCLEMDLVGYGKTFEAAYKALEELIEMQIDFAVSMNQPTLLYHPAPPDIFRTFDQLFTNHLQHFAGKKQETDKGHRIANLPLPSISRKAGPSFVTC